AASWSAAPTCTRPGAGGASSWEAGRSPPGARAQPPPTEGPMSVARRLPALAAIMLAAALVAGCGKRAEQQAPAATSAPSSLKVGLVFDVGGRGDKSFNDAAYAGLERAKRELGVDYVT